MRLGVFLRILKLYENMIYDFKRFWKIIYNHLCRCLIKALKQAETDNKVDGVADKETDNKVGGVAEKEAEGMSRLMIYLNCMQDTLSK